LQQIWLRADHYPESTKMTACERTKLKVLRDRKRQLELQKFAIGYGNGYGNGYGF